MARKSKNDGTKELAWMLTIMTVGIVLLVKWTIEAIVWIFKAIAKFITWVSNKQEQKKKINNITATPFTNNKIKEEILNLPEPKVKEKLNIFDKSIYNEMFPIQIRSRGENYFEEGKIKYYKQTDNKYTCIVKGSEDYKVSILFDENSDEINEMNCTCPYYADKNNNCKHIYALLYKIKCSNNKEKIIEEIKEQLRGIKEMINKTQQYINSNMSHFSTNVINDYNSYIHSYDYKYNIIESKLSNKTLEDTLIKYLEELVYISSDLKHKIKKTLENEQSTQQQVIHSNKNKDSKVGLTEVVAGIAIADYLTRDKDDEYENESEYTEEEMDDYGLEDWQKDLVRKGEYNPWNFEEEDLEEDDYYYEDD